MIHTTIPSRPRTEVITYTVLPGDTVSGIAEKFGLRVQTVMWGNYLILVDNPHAISVGQELNILPIDGTYHKWSAGEGLNGVAEGYQVNLRTSSTGLVTTSTGSRQTYSSKYRARTFLVKAGGTRIYQLSKHLTDDPSIARCRTGACGTILDGAVGFGSFIWPSANHFLSGYDYSPATNHYGIDIDGDLGTPLWASDAGVVVYAGWNDHGYGNMVVVDHGGDWQTLYAHGIPYRRLRAERFRVPRWAPSAPPALPAAHTYTSKC
jgi:murein DD-endopeptidase MepM/ murein hydrolase activator NlpD